MKNPPNKKPMVSFAEVMRAAGPPAGPAGSPEPPGDGKPLRFALSVPGGGGTSGYLGQNSLGYAILVTDQEQALLFECCPSQNLNYYRIKGSRCYLSVGSSYLNYPVGFYGWNSAMGWTVSGTQLLSSTSPPYPLSLCSSVWGGCLDGYLYAYSAAYYTAQNVTFETIPTPVIPANPPLTPLIEHIVVLMLENRSFDNMLGGLYPNKTQAEYRGVNGLSLAEKTIPKDPGDPGKGSVTAFQGPAGHATWIMPYPDPGELFNDMNEQLFGVSSELKQCDQVAPCKPGSLPTMQGFAWNYAKQPGAPLQVGVVPIIVSPTQENIMQYYSEAAVPMFWFLAKQFAVCDDWFASGPVQTLANRIFAHCGTPGLVSTTCARIDNPDFTEGLEAPPLYNPPVTDKTIFQLLDETYPGEINWKVYYHDAPASALCSYVYENWDYLRSGDCGNVYSWVQNTGTGMTYFEYDIQNNRLPKYSFIEPCYEDNLSSLISKYNPDYTSGPVNSYHPGGAGVDTLDPNGSSLPPPISVLDGEYFLKQVYEILANNMDTFKKTLLIVIFDEHGGLWDHVPPPCAVSPFVQPVQNFSYDRYGVRIPALLINPYIPPGTIHRASDSGRHFDHTSLISTVCAQFGLNGKLTPRSTAAPTLANLIPDNPKFNDPPAPPPLPPAQPKLAAAEPAAKVVAPAKMDAAAAMAVIRKQKHPHALAGALIPLVAIAQQGKK